MDFSDEATPVYVPDEDKGSDSDDSMFDTDSSSRFTMSTLTSDEIADYFHLVHGYHYTSDENIPLVFPVVSDTVHLNVVFHTIVRLCLDGVNVPLEVNELLRAGGANNSAEGPRVLDVMTNCGTWVKEMAETYSNTKFLSIDVKPLLAFEPHPRITYEVYDIYAGIAEPDASFDVVHARQCVMTARNFNFLLREMHRVLKPNGILVITELPTQGYEGSDPSKILESAPHQTVGLRLYRAAMASQGVELAVWDDLSERLSPSHSQWTERSIDPVAGIVEIPHASDLVRGFYSIKEDVRLVPNGPWHKDPTQRVIGTLSRLLFTRTWSALRPLLRIMGMGEDQAQVMVDGILKEFADGEIQAYVKCHRWTARKI